MSNDQILLSKYRLLEFPNETDESWPGARNEPDEHLVPLVRLMRKMHREREAVADEPARAPTETAGRSR